MLWGFRYSAIYINAKADESLTYIFTIMGETPEECDKTARDYAMWILEELPQSGFVLHDVRRVYKND